MRRLALLAACLALVLPGSASAMVDNQYAKWKLFQPYGYRDLKLEPARWKIRSLSYHAGLDFTVAMGLHRIAVHAKANGFSRFYTVSMKITCSNLFAAAPTGCKGTSLDEEVDIVAVGFNDSDAVPACEETGDWAANCRSFDADETLAYLREPLGLSAAQVEQEIKDASVPRKRK